jgi:hypothetical protein
MLLPKGRAANNIRTHAKIYRKPATQCPKGGSEPRAKADYARAETEYNNAIKQPILKPATTHDLP